MGISNFQRAISNSLYCVVILLGSLELPESNVDGDATLALGLQLVHHPRVLEGALGEGSDQEGIVEQFWHPIVKKKHQGYTG